MDSAAVIWVVHVDKRGASNQRYRNRNASLIRKSQVEGEEEYLFVPYSVFTVTKVVRGESSGFSRPFEIHVQAALDNALEPQDLQRRKCSQIVGLREFCSILKVVHAELRKCWKSQTINANADTQTRRHADTRRAHVRT